MHTVKKAPPPTRTIDAWLTLEVLSPQKLPKSKDLEAIGRQLVRLNEFSVPWERPTKITNPNEKGYYWFVYLGEINLVAAIDSLLKIFPNKGGGEFGSPKGEAAMAVIVLDSEGRPVDEKSFLSSFAWGYGKVRCGELKTLHSFIVDEKLILEEFNKKLITQDEDGSIKPLNAKHINILCDWLIEKLNLPPEQIKKPGIAVRVPVWTDGKDVPEPELLNSFFLEDLYHVKREYECGTRIGNALTTYMKAKSEKDYVDIVTNEFLLKNTLRPSRLPQVRWPVKGRYPLYMMQQAAVNHIRDELNQPGIASVNGPPGTGKTTLLRDVVANVVFERACILADYKNPEKAFSHTGKIRTGSSFTHLYAVNKNLLGHEIVVASSNNKAVENISKDIPGVNEVADDFSEPLRYFSTIADCLAADKKDKNKDTLPSQCWGIAAAVLGNSSNKHAFVNDFWWNENYGMMAYLKSVGKELNEDSPKIASLENAPTSHQQAIDNWKIAREQFKVQNEKVKEIVSRFEIIHESLVMLDEVAHENEKNEKKYDECVVDFNRKQTKYSKLKESIKSICEEKDEKLLLLSATKELKPGLLSRLFRTKVFKDWKVELSEILNDIKTINKNKAELTKNKAETKKNYDSAEFTKNEQGIKLTNIKERYDSINKEIATGKEILGVNLPDVEFWENLDQIKQKSSPWINNCLQNERDELFVLSFKVHRAFIDVAAKQIRNNLNAVMIVLKNGSIDSEYKKIIPSLWASLFMVLPVVSTTFASFSRLFSTLGCEEIGWLLLDESGQALPQAAVGALWRSKRVAVIGDPLQIEPVVSIPNQLIKAIFEEYKVEVDDWAPPVMSVQTLTDRTSWFGSMVETNDGEIWVGSPLRVHRRCIEPMFSIANIAAYNGLMVSDTPKSHSIIGDILGDSVWFDIQSQSVGKWSRAEGKLVVSLLHQLFDEGVTDPDIFIITPFRNVADQLKNMITRDVRIKNVIGNDNIWKWAFDRIGTVHTFQGKEAEAVMFVLGATGDEYAGSRAWAGSKPNILNVAVTRAKQKLYVIGKHKDWHSAGMFRLLNDKICISESKEVLRGQA